MKLKNVAVALIAVVCFCTLVTDARSFIGGVESVSKEDLKVVKDDVSRIMAAGDEKDKDAVLIVKALISYYESDYDGAVKKCDEAKIYCDNCIFADYVRACSLLKKGDSDGKEALVAILRDGEKVNKINEYASRLEAVGILHNSPDLSLFVASLVPRGYAGGMLSSLHKNDAKQSGVEKIVLPERNDVLCDDLLPLFELFHKRQYVDKIQLAMKKATGKNLEFLTDDDVKIVLERMKKCHEQDEGAFRMDASFFRSNLPEVEKDLKGIIEKRKLGYAAEEYAASIEKSADDLHARIDNSQSIDAAAREELASLKENVRMAVEMPDKSAAADDAISRIRSKVDGMSYYISKIDVEEKNRSEIISLCEKIKSIAAEPKNLEMLQKYHTKLDHSEWMVKAAGVSELYADTMKIAENKIDAIRRMNQDAECAPFLAKAKIPSDISEYEMVIDTLSSMAKLKDVVCKCIATGLYVKFSTPGMFDGDKYTLEITDGVMQFKAGKFDFKSSRYYAGLTNETPGEKCLLLVSSRINNKTVEYKTVSDSMYGLAEIYNQISQIYNYKKNLTGKQ